MGTLERRPRRSSSTGAAPSPAGTTWTSTPSRWRSPRRSSTPSTTPPPRSRRAAARGRRRRVGAQPRPPAERHDRRPLHRGRARARPGAAGGLLRVLGAAHRDRPRGAARCSRSCARWACKRRRALQHDLAARVARGVLRARRGLRPDRRRRLHQRDPVDQAVPARLRARRWRRSASTTRRRASTSATGSSTTSGAPVRPGCAAIHVPLSTIPAEQVGHTEGEPRRGGARPVADARRRAPPGLTRDTFAGLRSAERCNRRR